MSKFISGPHHSGLSIPEPAQLILPQRFRNGRFRSQVIRNGNQCIFDSGFHRQVMTNAFFDTYCGGTLSRAGLLGYAAVGTGLAEAAPGDTTITQVGPRRAAQSVESSASIAGNVITQRIQYRFNQGDITTPVTEAALFANTSGGSTMVRSRLKDGGGASTSIPLTSFDALYLTWEVDSVVDLAAASSVVAYGGDDYNVNIKPAYWTADATANPQGCGNVFAAFAHSNAAPSLFGFAAAYLGASQTLTTDPAIGVLTSAAVSSVSVGSYTAGSYQRTVSYVWAAGNAAANALGGVGCASVRNASNGSGYQISFAAVSGGGRIPKDETNQFRLDLTLAYSV